MQKNIHAWKFLVLPGVEINHVFETISKDFK